MNDAEIREAIDRIKKNPALLLAYYHTDIETLIALATCYLELGGVVEEKKCLVGDYYKKGYVCGECPNCEQNKGRQDALLAVSKRLEGVEETIKSVIKDGGGFPKVDDLSTAIRESILGKEGGNEQRTIQT